MNLAKASPQDLDAMANLDRLLNALSCGFPCLPNGEWKEDDPDFFDPEDEDHRVILGFQTAFDNDVFDPDADHLDWHPDLKPAVEDRDRKRKEAA